MRASIRLWTARATFEAEVDTSGSRLAGHEAGGAWARGERPGGAAFAWGAVRGRVQVLPATPRRLQLRLPETEQQ